MINTYRLRTQNDYNEHEKYKNSSIAKYSEKNLLQLLLFEYKYTRKNRIIHKIYKLGNEKLLSKSTQSYRFFLDVI